MAFRKMTMGTLGLFAGVALAAFATVRGCSEAIKDNEPGETNTEQFARGFVQAPVDALKGAIKGISGAFDSKDVRNVLEDAEKAGRNVIDGAGEYIDSKGGGRRSGGPIEPLPDYVPGVIPGDPPKDSTGTKPEPQ